MGVQRAIERRFGVAMRLGAARLSRHARPPMNRPGESGDSLI